MRRFRRSNDAQQVDISPLIDMVFILLIFFMVSTTFVKDMKIDIERPGAASASRASSKAVRVYIDAQGSTYINDTAVRSYMLQSRVREQIRQGAKSVLVICDRRTPSEKLIEVVDQCRLAGAKDVAVASDKEAQ